jgi:hypothetical protein
MVENNVEKNENERTKALLYTCIENEECFHANFREVIYFYCLPRSVTFIANCNFIWPRNAFFDREVSLSPRSVTREVQISRSDYFPSKLFCLPKKRQRNKEKI